MWERWSNRRPVYQSDAIAPSPIRNARSICSWFSTESLQRVETLRRKRSDRWKKQQNGLECAIKTSTARVTSPNVCTFGFSHRHWRYLEISGNRLAVTGFFSRQRLWLTVISNEHAEAASDVGFADGYAQSWWRCLIGNRQVGGQILGELREAEAIGIALREVEREALDRISRHSSLHNVPHA